MSLRKSLNHHPSISPQARGLNVQELYDSEQCGKDFNDHSCLRTHRSTQNGGNPYEDNQDGKTSLLCTTNPLLRKMFHV